MGSHSSRPAPRIALQDEPAPHVAKALNAIRRIVRALRISASTAEMQSGLSGAQLFVLQHLAEDPGLSVGELAERTMTDQSSVSVVVRRLVDRGLVVRSPSAIDGRRVEVRLTPKGRALLRRAPPMAQAHLISGLRRLEPAEARSLTAGLERLVQAMGASDGEPEMFFEDEAPLPSSRRRRVRA